MINDISKKTLHTPAKLMLGYLLLSVFMFLFSMFRPELQNGPLFVFYVLLCDLFAYFGFIVGTDLIKIEQPKKIKTFNIDLYLNVIFWLALVLGVFKFMLYTGDRSFSLIDKIAKFFKGTYSFSDAYNERHNLVAVTGGWRIINYITILAGPVHWIYMPLSLYYWKRLNWFKKIVSLVIIFLYVFQYIGSGASVGFVYLTLFVVSVYFYKYALMDSSARKQKQIPKKKKKLRLILVVLLFAVLAVMMFGTIMNSRVIGNKNTSFITVGDSVWTIDTSNVFYKLLPAGIINTCVSIYAYLFKPYAALDMALSVSGSVDIPMCFGAGGSWFLADNVKSIFGIDIIQRTYNMRLDEIFGYNYYTQWHTVYVWIANDFSFYLVPLVLFVLMCIFGVAWKDYLQNKNAFALILMVLFAEFVFFMPMNNQVFQHADTLFAFWGVLIVWLFTRKTYEWAHPGVKS